MHYTIIRAGWCSLHTLRRMSVNKKPDVIFVLGAPGAGKGTQCLNIVKEYEFQHISAGELLREEMSRECSSYGELIKENMKTGTIVPVQITCSLIEKAMKASSSNKFLIDGFPRNQENLDGWNKHMAHLVNLLFVLFFDCPLEVCTTRCLERGAAGSGRMDDNAESLKRRFETYFKENLPIVSHFESLELLRKIDGSKSPDKVFEEVKEIFGKFSSPNRAETI